MLLEFVPLLSGRRSHLAERAQAAPTFDEELVCGDHLVGEHSV
ncbi:hypothetical protein [Kribbella sp. NPDC006257]